MKRYYFDLRDGDYLAVDEEGTELPDMAAVQEEAALSLAGMARDARGLVENSLGDRWAIEVRDETGPILQVKFTFEVDRRKH